MENKMNEEEVETTYNTAFIVLETNKGTIVANAIQFKDRALPLEELLEIDHPATDDDLDRVISEIFMHRASKSDAVRNILLTLLTRASEQITAGVAAAEKSQEAPVDAA